MNSSTSSDWYVQLADREIGPLTVEQLAGLARDGQLLAADKVRSGGSGEWVTATNVKGLVFASPREEVRERAGVASITAAPTKSDIPWYVKIRGEVIGPLSEAELARLAESGAINAHSPTRQGPEGSWRSAGQIRWLSLRPPSSSPPIAPSASSKSAPSQADQQATSAAETSSSREAILGYFFVAVVAVLAVGWIAIGFRIGASKGWRAVISYVLISGACWRGLLWFDSVGSKRFHAEDQAKEKNLNP